MKYTLGNSRFEVNGKQYLKDVGGYNGTNKDSSKDVATVIGSKIDSMINVTYSQLVDMRDNGELIPGQQYRITDYITTTVQVDTESAGHQFDIIVTANSNNTLSEIASACLHEGDTYFSGNNANLSAWQIWYCLDNDTDRFEWADDTNGKGVIYRMIDEWANDCPYDFKNIKFTRPIFSETDTPDSNFYYTFCSSVDIIDISIFGNKYNYNVYNNVIKSYIDIDGFQSLNRILFIGIVLSSKIDNNTFGANCRNNEFVGNCNSNTFGTNCTYNTFGNDCYSNTFGNDCNSNTFGTNCTYNTFGNDCYENTFGNDCHSNKFGIFCTYNTFGEKCGSITFGTNCENNEFVGYCRYITFGTNCACNKFGTDCYDITFGEYCIYNIFGTGITPSTLKSYYRNIIFDNGNCFIKLNCTKSTSSSSYYQNVRIGLGVNNGEPYKTINDTNNVGQPYETLYIPTGSLTIKV